MKVELIDLLNIRAIAHPSRVRSILLKDNELCLTLHGWQWWRKDPHGPDEGDIIFRFLEVEEGSLDLGWLCPADNIEVLEEFSVRLAGDLEWEKPSVFAIYCNGPLKNPLGRRRTIPARPSVLVAAA